MPRSCVKNTSNGGVLWLMSRRKTKKEKENTEGVFGLVARWACGMCRPKERKKRKIVRVRLV